MEAHFTLMRSPELDIADRMEGRIEHMDEAELTTYSAILSLAPCFFSIRSKFPIFVMFAD